MNHRRTARRRGGFTLIEVLLVMAILGVIAGMVVPRLLGRQTHANSDATRLTIKGLEQAVKLYALDHHGVYPSSAEGIGSLLQPPSGDSVNWRGPYLDAPPKDAWGRPLTYAYPGRRNARGYDISSSGPDGIQGTSDDIFNDSVTVTQ
jgi:general secretion pathway protein G